MSRHISNKSWLSFMLDVWIEDVHRWWYLMMLMSHCRVDRAPFVLCSPNRVKVCLLGRRSCAQVAVDLTTNSRTLRLQMATAAMLLFYFVADERAKFIIIYPHQIAAACYNFSLILSHFGGSLVGAPASQVRLLQRVEWRRKAHQYLSKKKRLFRNLPDEVPWLWFISACLCWHK